MVLACPLCANDDRCRNALASCRIQTSYSSSVAGITGMAFLGSADHRVRCGCQEAINEMRTIQKSVSVPARYSREAGRPDVPGAGSASNLIKAVENDDRVRSGRDGTIAAEPCFALTSITSLRSTAMPDKDLNELFPDTLPKRPSTPKPLRGKS